MHCEYPLETDLDQRRSSRLSPRGRHAIVAIKSRKGFFNARAGGDARLFWKTSHVCVLSLTRRCQEPGPWP